MLVDTPICDFGLKAPDFELISHNEKSYSRDGLAGSNGLLIAFICNHCPYVKAIIENFVSDAKKLRSIGIQTVAIMPNNYVSYPADSPEKMNQLWSRLGLKFPYLFDESQEVAKKYKAECTPEFYLFNLDKKLVYRGRMDDSSPGSNIDPSGRDLRLAIDNLINNKKISEEQYPSMGCNIKWKTS